MVWSPAREISGGRRGLGLMFIRKLGREDKTTWVEMPVAPMVKKEPTSCQEARGECNSHESAIHFAAHVGPARVVLGASRTEEYANDT